MAIGFALPLLMIVTQLSIWAASVMNGRSSIWWFWSLAAVGINIACALHYINNADKYVEDQASRAVLGTLFAGNAFGSFERLLVSKWSLDAGGPEKFRERPASASKSSSRAVSLQYRLDLLSNHRGIGKPWQVKNVPQFSSSDPKYVPSKAKFLAWHAVSFMFCVLVLDLEAQLPYPDPKLYSLEMIPMLGRIGRFSWKEIVFRLSSTFIFWLNSAVGVASNTHLASFIAVVTGLSDLEDWPPFFGPVTKLYTIRHFWGTVWHQGLRATFDGISNFIAHDVLYIANGTLFARYLKIWIAFIISGLIHAGMAERKYDIWGSGTVRFFCTQAFGIMLEDAVQALWPIATGYRSKEGENGVWRKVVGFLWLLVFLTWSTPTWSYRMFQYYSPGIYHLLPFSIISYIV